MRAVYEEFPDESRTWRKLEDRGLLCPESSPSLLWVLIVIAGVGAFFAAFAL